LAVVDPGISTATIVGTTCGILVVLFFIQPLGTTRIATTFAPIVIIWLGFNGGFGIYNLATYDWTVLKAFSPYFAIKFFVEKKTEAWKMLGANVVAILVVPSGWMKKRTTRMPQVVPTMVAVLMPGSTTAKPWMAPRTDWAGVSTPSAMTMDTPRTPMVLRKPRITLLVSMAWRSPRLRGATSSDLYRWMRTVTSSRGSRLDIFSCGNVSLGAEKGVAFGEDLRIGSGGSKC